MSKFEKESNTLISSCCLEELPEMMAEPLLLTGKGTLGKIMGLGGSCGILEAAEPRV